MNGLKEQKQNNLNRSYYHGYRVMDPNLKTCEEFYLTTSFIYAASYAGRKGHVDVYNFKNSVNIFNLNCKSDLDNLKKVLGDISINVNELKKRDWFSYFKGDIKKRRKLLDLVESLGYDGYFNREVDKELMQHSVAANSITDRRLYNSPSIGIFNKDCLIKTGTVDDIPNNYRIQKYRDLELDYIEYYLLKTYKESKSLSEAYDVLSEQILNFNSKQIMSIISKFNYKEFEKDYNDLCKEFGDISLFTEKKLIYYQRPIIRW